MSHMFARLINSCKPEHELRNVQPQIKGISKSIDSFHKDLLGTVREIGRWQIHQEPPIQNYLSTMAQFEEEIAAASVEYTEGYSRFAEFWDAVLDEHKSLQETEKQHDKASKVVEKHLGKKIKAETQEEVNEVKVADESVALSDAQAHEQDLRNRLHAKMLGYEKNLHRNLRMAYYILHIARLDYYRKCTDISQRAIEAIGTLQDVREIKEFEFLYQPFSEPINEMARPYWSYGKTKKQPITSISRQAIRQDLGAAQPGASGGPATPSQRLLDIYTPTQQFPAQQAPVPLQQLLQQQPVPPHVQAQVLPAVPQLQNVIFHPDEAISPEQVQQLQQPQLLQQAQMPQQPFQQQQQQQPLQPLQLLQQQQQQQVPSMQQLEQQQPHPPQALLQQINELGQQPSQSRLQQMQQPSPVAQSPMPVMPSGSDLGKSQLRDQGLQAQPLSQFGQGASGSNLNQGDVQTQLPISQVFGQDQGLSNISNISSNPASATSSFDNPSEIPSASNAPLSMGSGIGSSQFDQSVGQFGAEGESMGSGLDTGAGMSSQHEMSNPNVDFTPLYKPSEVMHMQKMQQKPATSSSLNPPSYMNPPSSSMNPDYSSSSKVSDVDVSLGNKPSSDVGMTTTRTGETTF